jgi:hypothetical protein
MKLDQELSVRRLCIGIPIIFIVPVLIATAPHLF